MKLMTDSIMKILIGNGCYSEQKDSSHRPLFILIYFLLTTTTLAQEGKLNFRTGFETGSKISQTDPYHADITGIDTSVSSPNDWVKSLEKNRHLSRFGIQYGAGKVSLRIADIVPDPLNSKNKVLKFWFKGPVKGKARIQSNLSGRRNLKQWYAKSRIFLHPDLSKLKKHPGAIGIPGAMINGHPIWFTFEEYWNNPGWGKPVKFPFRMTLAIRKESGIGKKLYFGLIAEKFENSTYVDIWNAGNKDYTIPFGEWLTSETYFKEGDKKTGRYYWALTDKNGNKTVMFDIHNFTHHPDDPAPDGMEIFSPFKLYTSPTLIDVIRNNGGVAQIYWDDWEIWTGFPPAKNKKTSPKK